MLLFNSIQMPWDIYKACICANGSNKWSSKGWCLATGKHNGSILRCEWGLFEVAGVVDLKYAGTIDTSAANTIDVGTAGLELD
jgi:hypothetical protein